MNLPLFFKYSTQLTKRTMWDYNIPVENAPPSGDIYVSNQTFNLTH